jgi:release factor glutamine methyltransferase
MTLLRGSPSPEDATTDLVRFGGLQVELDPDVLEPRPWTVAQARWGARLAEARPDGPALELYAGGGQIGLELARLTGRPVVQVEASAAACHVAWRNAQRNGLDHLVTVRNMRVGTPLRERRRFAVVLADPPYVPGDDVARYPDDPRAAIDGGPDGLDEVRQLIRALPRYLAADTPVLLQLRGAGQVDELQQLLAKQRAPLRVVEVRSHGPDRAVARLRPR